MAIPAARAVGAIAEVRDIFSVISPTPILSNNIQALPTPKIIFSSSSRPLERSNLLARRSFLSGNMLHPPSRSHNDFSLFISLGLTGGLAGLAFFAAKKHPVFGMALLLLGAAACAPQTNLQISYSEIQFNPLMKGNLGPSDAIQDIKFPFMNAHHPDKQKSDLYPSGHPEIEKFRKSDKLYLSNERVRTNALSISWEALLKGVRVETEDYSFNTDVLRHCVPLTHPETGKPLILNTPDGEEVDLSTKPTVSLLNLDQYTIGLEICSQAAKSPQANPLPSLRFTEDCESHDLRTVLGIEDRALLTQGVSCYIDAQIPSRLIPAQSSFTLFLADRNLSRDNLKVMTTPHPLSPSIQLIDGCETFTYPLRYRPDLSAETEPANVVNSQGDTVKARRFRWCWSVEDETQYRVRANLENGLAEFFSPDLKVAEVRTCQEIVTDGKTECRQTNGQQINVGPDPTVDGTELGEFDCPLGVDNNYLLAECQSGELHVTPTHDPRDPEHPLTWCLEDRIYRNTNGSYPRPKPFWEKETPLKMQFKVCEIP